MSSAAFSVNIVRHLEKRSYMGAAKTERVLLTGALGQIG